ncbi:hypothetical protein C6P45_005354 [Maudiozyma exigua]|uniref:D-isomer specific 2-hydroxyacid dehydrogenase NAD-binding domain-containing protein n=1 Tax=Maudiozyma exigua TaxID=34358 RepID=A0A9P6WAK1_MAUEX|nr:hypothetical protein C6P45_005354 [Kazachstania exigua]
MSKTILCVQTPNMDLPLFQDPQFQSEYTVLVQEIKSHDQLLQLLNKLKNENVNIVAIYAGFGAFPMMGGLTRKLIEHSDFPSDSLKCITLCSRGYNGYDLEALKEHGIALYIYQDSELDSEISDFKLDQVGNDVADCAMWHIMEGFRKFSYQQSILRENGNTIQTRSIIATLESNKNKKENFAFGHSLPNDQFVLSPRGKKCLILGFGSIGKQIATKLQFGLGMEVHYAARHDSYHTNWEYHNINQLLKDDNNDLKQFNAIVIALPATPETFHLINSKFLAKCNKQLVIVNVGRGDIIDMNAMNEAVTGKRIRHFGTDVFHNEPQVDTILRKDVLDSTVTPHIGSATKELFTQSCELAFMNIVRTTSDSYNKNEPHHDHMAELCRVI